MNTARFFAANLFGIYYNFDKLSISGIEMMYVTFVEVLKLGEIMFLHSSTLQLKKVKVDQYQTAKHKLLPISI